MYRLQLITESKYEFYLLDNTIIEVIYCQSKEGLNLEDAKSAVKFRIDFSNGQKYPILISKIATRTITHEALEYFASEEGCRLISCCGIVYDNKFIFYFLKMLSRFKKYPFPLKLFNDRELAIKWLLENNA